MQATPVEDEQVGWRDVAHSLGFTEHKLRCTGVLRTAMA